MVIICIINERRVLWKTESVTVSSLWQYEIPDDGDYLYYKWENGIVNVSTSLWQHETPDDGDYLFHRTMVLWMTEPLDCWQFCIITLVEHQLYLVDV